MLREERESGVTKMEGKLAREVVDFGRRREGNILDKKQHRWFCIDGYFE